MNENNESFVNLSNARNDHQREVMSEIVENQECPFCPEALHKYHKQPILRSGEHWIVTPNQWPYDNTRVHLLAITAYHAERLTDLQPGSFDELQSHFAWAEQEFKIAAGGLAMRFGDTTSNGATVRHLHSHLIAPQDGLTREQKVRFKIG